MKSHSKKEVLIRYLLGQLSEREQGEIERRYFNDDDFNEHLEIVEEELIDDYVRERLSETDRQQFERCFLRSVSGRERVAIARQWRGFISRSSQPAKPASETTRQTSWLRLLTFRRGLVLVPLAAMILLAMSLAWMMIQNIRLKNQVEEMRSTVAEQERNTQELRKQADAERHRNEQLAEELEQERNRPQAKPEIPIPRAHSTIASFVLNPGLMRSGSNATRLSIPPDASRVRFTAVFKSSSYTDYAAELQTVEGRVIWSQRGLKAKTKGDDRVIDLMLPSNVLKDEDYIFFVNGVTSTGEIKSVSEYSFRIVR